MTTSRLTTLRPRVQPVNLQRASPLPHTADAFYLSREWREARALSIALHLHSCAQCNRSGVRLFVDHITELKDGGAPLDQSNLRPLCGSCHTLKTNRTRGERMSRRYPRPAPRSTPDEAA